MSLGPYQVGTFRAAGLEAKWVRRRNGGPIIVARTSSAAAWVQVGASLWQRAGEIGLAKAMAEVPDNRVLAPWFPSP